MPSPTAQAYSDLDRKLSPYLRHRPPSLTGFSPDLSPHPEFTHHWPLWATMRDCYDGEHVIKAAGQTYLRKLSAHKDEEYLGFLSRAYFYNAVRRTVNGLMGSLFRKPAEFTIPASVPLDLDNVTLDGQSADELLRACALELILTGRIGILRDLPSDGVGDPYLALYAAESIYGWRVTLHRGRRVVDRVVLLEQETQLTEYGETLADVVRILRLDPDPDSPGDLAYSQEIHRSSTAEGQPNSVTRVPVSVLGQRLRRIPFEFVNPTDLLPRVQVPPLMDIATLNISHYQSTALLEHARFYAGMPTYVTSAGTGGQGFANDSPPGTPTFSDLTVGPSNVWELEEGAKAWILEFNGHGLTFLENATDSKQLQMQSLGGKLISAQRRAAALSSEAWSLLEQGDEATLNDIALSLERAFQRSLTGLAEMRGRSIPKDQPIVVELNKEFVRSDLTARELRAIQSLYERQLIPKDVLYYALREVNVIPIEYSLEDFTKLLEKKEQLYEAPTPPPLPFNPNKPPSQPPRNDGRGSGTGSAPE